MQFRRLAVAGVVAGGFWGAVPSLANNPPVPTCTTSTCQVVEAPSGWIAYTNVVLAPESPLCLGTWVYAEPEVDWRCCTFAFDHAARLRFHNLISCLGRVGFFENHDRPFCAACNAPLQKHTLQNPQ